MGQSRAFFAKMCRGWAICAGDFHARRGEGSTAGRGQRQSLQGANQAARDWALSSRILLDAGHFYQTKNLSNAMEGSFPVKGQGRVCLQELGGVRNEVLSSNPWLCGCQLILGGKHNLRELI